MTWPAPGEIPRQGRPGPSGSTVSDQRKHRPVEQPRTASVLWCAPAQHHRPAQPAVTADSLGDGQ